MSAVFSEGFDAGYSRAVEVIERENGLTARMAPPEYFWHYNFKFDLRDATRGEQEAIRVLFLAQRLSLDGFTRRHVELVELVLAHRQSWASRYVECGEFTYDDEVAAVRDR